MGPITQNQIDYTIKEINNEKHKLEAYNDELAKSVASTQALRAVKRQLEKQNRLLRMRLEQSQADQNVGDLEDVDAMFIGEGIEGGI